MIDLKMIEFQSTCPLRGTTAGHPVRGSRPIFQSTCPLRGTTQVLLIQIVQHWDISIHVPLAGHDG